jgi:fatty acid desaturase
MWEMLVAKIKASMRFPKRSTADLRWLKNLWIAFGIVWLAIGLFGWSGWPAVLAVFVGLGWLVQSALTVKEIRRRQQDATFDQPTV